MARSLDSRIQLVLEAVALGAIDILYALQRPGILAFGGFPADSHRWERRLADLRTSGIIARESIADSRTHRLTTLGLESLQGGRVPSTEWNRPWDGRWRLAVFDVAESHRLDRQKLRRTLRRAGLGRLQDSVWISPHPLTGLKTHIADLEANPGALLFLDGRPDAGESDASIVRHSWDFESLERQYLAVLECHRLLREPGISFRELHTALRTERELWLKAVRADPLLPRELHPPNYLGPSVEAARVALLRSAWSRVKAEL